MILELEVVIYFTCLGIIFIKGSHLEQSAIRTDDANNINFIKDQLVYIENL
mgnify:CR=1 FL=1